MSTHAEFLIWWISQRDVEALGDDVNRLPSYVRVALDDRIGRPGRGRLWCPSGVPLDVKVEPWPESAVARYVEANCGGIVFHAVDLIHLGTMPGLVTTLGLERA